MATQLFIDGEWVDAHGRTFPTVNPATGEVLAEVGARDHSDVDAAVAGARGALENPTWLEMNPVERANLLFKLADALEAAADEGARIETQAVGQPLGVSRNANIGTSIEHL